MKTKDSAITEKPCHMLLYTRLPHYCKTRYFHCILISGFTYIENSLHFNLVYFPGVDILCSSHMLHQSVFCAHHCLGKVLHGNEQIPEIRV